ncbi:hydrolase [Leptospira kobayashii]|uniref:Hydrolase n=1 Tax=Leptospira kobayashii TaxID=1917830 RepID=A0ABM7UNH0_9LEPT|nr:alpha/beta hydrolase [Leptospira kobayashii]BDA80551.1 hydrolase [Leptospira kobayashii]
MQKAKNLNLKIVGNGKETLLLGNGFGTDQSAWDKILPSLTTDYKVILFDLVGSGKTDPKLYSPIRYSSLFAYAEDLIELISETQSGPITYVSHSVSGMIGLLASNRRPELFKKLVFIGASPRYLNDKDYIGGFTQEALNQLYAAMETNFFGWTAGFAPIVMENKNNPDLAHSFESTLREIRPDIALSVAKTIFQSDHRQDLPHCKHEVLIIQSASDIAVPVEVGKYLEKNLSNGRYVQIQSEGHFPHISAPELVIKAMEGFI